MRKNKSEVVERHSIQQELQMQRAWGMEHFIGLKEI